MTDNPSDDHTRISLSWLLKLVAIFCVIFGIWKLNEPVPEPPPVKPEGWDNFRLIHSQQALDIISSPDRVIAYRRSASLEKANNSWPEKGYETTSEALLLDQDSAREFSQLLRICGKFSSDTRNLISMLPEYSLVLQFSKAEEAATLYFDCRSEVERVEIYQDGNRVGGFYLFETPIDEDKKQLVGVRLFELVKKIRSNISVEKSSSANNHITE